MKTWALIGSGAVLAVGGAVLVALSFTGGRDHGNTQVVDNSKPPGAAAPTSAPVHRSESVTIRLPDRTREIELARRQLEQEEEAGMKASVSLGEPLEPADLKSRLRLAISNAERDKDLSQLKELLSQLAGEEADVVAILKEEYKRSQGDVPRATIVINALKAMGSPRAAEVLRGIALDPGKDGVTLGPRAVKAYAAITKDSGRIASLLNSKEPQAVDAAIEQMRGLPLTDSAVNALGAQLDKSKSWVTHQLVAQSLGMDLRRDTADRKVGILMSVATTLGQLDAADTVEPELGLTVREVTLMIYAGSLADMKGSEQTLRGYLSDGNDVRKALAATALAQQGNRDVHDDVLRIASQSKDGLLRLIAVSALKKVVTEQDMAFLQQLAQNDPYRRPAIGRQANGQEWRYPVRDAARDVLNEIQRKMDK